MNKALCGISANEVWLQAAALFQNRIGTRTQSSRGGETEELLHIGFTIKDPRQRWVVSRRPAMNPAFALAEVVWIINGSRDAEIINHWNPCYPQYAGHSETYHGAYGFRLRSHFGFDQLERAYQVLKNNTNTRQVVLQIWDPNSDLPKPDGEPIAQDIPCNICSMLKVRDNKLEWTQVLRSNDLFLGVPHNFVQFMTLQEIMAGWLSVELGTYCQISDSLHVYHTDREKILASQPLQVEANTDSLCKPKCDSDLLFAEMFRRMKIMTKSNVSKTEFRKIADLDEPETAFQNLLLVIAADSARRKDWKSLATGLMENCTNPVYHQLWTRWLNRFDENVN